MHLEELDVHPDHGRRGLGSSLVMAVRDWAAATGHEAITLTTFRESPGTCLLRFARIHRGSTRCAHACAGIARVRGGSSRPRSSAARSHASRSRRAALARRIDIRMLTVSTIRPVRDSDRASLVSIWERSVRSTHHFLTSADIEYLRPLAAMSCQQLHRFCEYNCALDRRRTSRISFAEHHRFES